jgi:hypothetical protein
MDSLATSADPFVPADYCPRGASMEGFSLEQALSVFSVFGAADLLFSLAKVCRHVSTHREDRVVPLRDPPRTKSTSRSRAMYGVYRNNHTVTNCISSKYFRAAAGLSKGKHYVLGLVCTRRALFRSLSHRIS